MVNSTRMITSAEHADFQTEWHTRNYSETAEYAAERGKRLATAIRRATFKALGNNLDQEAPRGKIDGERVRRIMIFRYDAVGDYIVSTSLIRWLRAALPHAPIDIISSHRNESLIAADPLIDRSYPLHPTRTLAHPLLLNLLRNARGREYDLLFALPTNRMTRCALLARLVTPGAEKISLLHRPRRTIYANVFHHQVERPTGLEHWSETFLRMATETIMPVVEHPSMKSHPYLVLQEPAWRKVAAFMRSEGLGFGGFDGDIKLGKGWEGKHPEPFPGEPYCVVNISAHCSERQWSADRCAAACAMLIDRYPTLRLYVTGAPTDAADVRRVVEDVDHPNCSQLSMKLTEFIGFVAGAVFVITPDTATLHIAAAAGKPVVGLYAEEVKAAEWYPYGTRFALLVSPSETSIDLIEPHEVVEGVEKVMEPERVRVRREIDRDMERSMAGYHY